MDDSNDKLSNKAQSQPSFLRDVSGSAFVLLTEDLMIKFKRKYNDSLRLEFQKQAPKKGGENQYWSNWYNDAEFRMIIEPCYDYDFIGHNPVKSTRIKFWYVWQIRGNNIMPLMSIRDNKLLYVHQIQNLFHCIAGCELVLI